MAIIARLETKPSVGRQYWTHNVGDLTGPVAQFRMSQLVDYDQRLTDPARTVYRFLIGWYVRGHGDALASVRHIVATMRSRAPDGARHLSRSAVQRAIILLMDTGWLVRRYTGKGRSGSRYVPVLNVLELAAQGTLPQPANDSVPLYRDTIDESVASHSTGTAVSHSTGTLTAIASHSTGTRTLLPDPRTDAGTGKEEYDCAPPTAPPGAAACAPAGTGNAQESEEPSFEELWRAYGYRQKRADAKLAYEALAPDADLHRTMVDAAAAWHEHWTRQNNPEAPRRTLAGWIKAECYLEDPPAAYKPKERKPDTRKALTEKAPAPSRSTYVDGKPIGRSVVEIIEADTVEASGATDLVLRLKVYGGRHAGEEFSHVIILESGSADKQAAGQRELQRLLDAANLGGIEDTDDLLFRTLVAEISAGGNISYQAPTASECVLVAVEDSAKPTA